MKQIPVDSLGLLTLVHNKTVYRLIDIPDIRHRRMQSWPVMFRRLLTLDYVLEHPDLPWLPTETEKVACFDQLEIKRDDLPRRVWRNANGRTERLFANKHPIAIDHRTKTAHFVYTDSDEKTLSGLRSWKDENRRLWTALSVRSYSLRIVHVSFNTRLNKSVSRVFSNWTNKPRQTVPVEEVESHLDHVRNAIRFNNTEELAAYGGFNGALKAATTLDQRLQHLRGADTYGATYSTWFSDRMHKATRNPYPSGPRSHP